MSIVLSQAAAPAPDRHGAAVHRAAPAAAAYVPMETLQSGTSGPRYFRSEREAPVARGDRPLVASHPGSAPARPRSSVH